MLPSPLSSLSFSSVSFLQFALALFEQLLVHSLLSLSPSLSIFHSRVFYLSFSSLRLSRFGNPDSITSPFCFFQIFLIHIYTLFLFHSIEIFIIESQRDISSDMLVHGDLLRFSLIAVFAARNCT